MSACIFKLIPFHGTQLGACCFVAASVNTAQQQQQQPFVIAAIVCCPSYMCKTAAPCEARTHDLQIMRLTRCLLRQRGHTCHIYASKHCPLLRLYTTCLVIAPVMTSGQMPWEDGLQASSDLNLPAAQGELAQMVERSLSMREVAGSMPAFSKEHTILTVNRSCMNDSSYCL